MLGFSEEIVSRVNLHYFLLISGNATLILCFALRTKNINFTISLMYYNNFVFKIVAEILLLPLVLRNLIVIWALDYRCCQTISEFYYQLCKGLQLLKIRLNLIQYFKSKIGSCGLLFLQETLQSKVEQKWKEDFHGKIFFSHGKTNSCGVLAAFFGTDKFTVKKLHTDHGGRILMLDVSINDSEYILINLCNANTEKEQIEVLSNLFICTTENVWYRSKQTPYYGWRF